MGSRMIVAICAACGLLAGAARADELDSALELARKTLAFVEQSAPQPEAAARLAAIEKQVEQSRRDRSSLDRAALCGEVRKLRRRIIFAHPLLDFDKILLNQRIANVPMHMCDQYLGRHSRPGPGLAVLESWKENPRVRFLLQDKLPPGMTYHPDLSFDGSRVLFAFCRDGGPSDFKAFFIYEAAVDGSQLRQLTGTPSDPMVGANGRQTVVIEDYDPCYLPDGGFAFISTRSQQFGRCHGGRYVPSYVLYRADADGSNIRQLSFNEANEWNPSVLHDGRIIYTRWDYINRHDTIFQSLWTMHCDGTQTAHYYGNYTRAPCMIAEARSIPGSHKVVATGTDHHGFTAGTIIVVDPRKGEDGPASLTCITPEIGSPEGGLPRETAAAGQPLREDMPPLGDVPGGKRAATPYPLSEDLFLVSYAHQDQYAIYLIDTLGGRELIYYDPQFSCFSPIPLRPTPKPPVLPSMIAGKEQEKTGRFYVQNVYQSSQPIERGTIKRLRVNEIISQPTRSKPILSRVDNEIVKRILGTVAVDADGSVAFEAPAAMPMQLQLLDENGMAVMTMRSLIYLQPGEQVTCAGCHESRNGSPGATAQLGTVRFQQLEPSAGPRYEGGFSFARTVQPVLDRYCVDCHGLEKTEGDINLLGERTGDFTASYDSLLDKGGVKIAQRFAETYYSKPKDYFAHAGTLAQMLLGGHRDKDGKPRVQLDTASRQRVVDWLDLNAQFYGDYSFNRIETQRPTREGEQALREAIAKRLGPKIAAEPFAALVNMAMPGESRILRAPLAAEAGGWGQIAGGWASTDDAAYQEMARLVEAAIPPSEFLDVAGTCGHDEGCRCGCCFVRLDHQTAGRRELHASTANSQ